MFFETIFIYESYPLFSLFHLNFEDKHGFIKSGIHVFVFSVTQLPIKPFYIINIYI